MAHVSWEGDPSIRASIRFLASDATFWLCPETMGPTPLSHWSMSLSSCSSFWRRTAASVCSAMTTIVSSDVPTSARGYLEDKVGPW